MNSIDILNSIYPTIKGCLDYGFPGKVWFGRLYQGKEDIEYTFNELKKSGVSVTWNLLERPVYLEEEANFFEKTYHSPIPNYDVPQDRDAFLNTLDEIISLLKEGKSIYVHCFGGCGRTGLALIALAARTGKNKEEWINIVYKACEGPETDEQIEFGVNCVK